MYVSKGMIEAMGFAEIPQGTEIEAFFNSVVVYSIQGINIKDLNTESLKDLSYKGSEFSLAFGNSVNEISQNLYGDDCVEDERGWQKKKEVKHPYLLIHFNIKEPFICTSGYWKRDEDTLLTYDCFNDAKQALRELEKKNISPLISSLTIQLSKFHRPIRFKLADRTVYAKTNSGEKLYDMRLNASFKGYGSVNVLPEKLVEKISDSLKQYSKLEPRVASLFFSGLQEDDRFKKFLYLFLSLEIHIHKTFKQIDFEKYVDKFNQSSARLKQFYIESYKQSKNLTQRFMLCSILSWENLEDSDVDNFKHIKKRRDMLMHGEEVHEDSLPVKELEDLLLKIL